MQIINVDLIPGKVMPILHASQFDKGRSLGVKLYNGGAVFELSGAEDLTAAVRKPDGNIVTETLTNAGGSLVEIITTEQMTACAGGSLCEIKIENAGDVIGTANFVLDVEKDPTDGGIESESEINNLATQVAAIVSEQYDSSNVFFDDEPTEGHGNGYAVTSQGIKRAINNVQDAVDEVNDKADSNATAIGDLSELTTSDKSSLVGAVNSFLPKVVYSEKNWANSHSFDTANDTAFMLYTDSDTSVAKVRIFNNNTASLYNISGSSITGVTYTNGTLTVAVNNRGLVAVRII